MPSVELPSRMSEMELVRGCEASFLRFSFHRTTRHAFLQEVDAELPISASQHAPTFACFDLVMNQAVRSNAPSRLQTCLPPKLETLNLPHCGVWYPGKRGRIVLVGGLP